MEKKYPIGELIKKLKENIITHMNPYNLGDEGETTRLIFQLIKIAEAQAPTGAVWVKASERLPKPMAPPILIPVKRYEADPTQYGVRAMTANQLEDIIKWDNATFEWLDESGIAPAPNPNELWDEYSELIPDNIDSLTRWAGSTVIDKEGFNKMINKLKQ